MDDETPTISGLLTDFDIRVESTSAQDEFGSPLFVLECTQTLISRRSVTNHSSPVRRVLFVAPRQRVQRMVDRLTQALQENP